MLNNSILSYGSVKSAIANIILSNDIHIIIINNINVVNNLLYIRYLPLLYNSFNLICNYNFMIKIKIYGGGIVSQFKSIKYAIIKALIKYNINYIIFIKKYSLLTRINKHIERKKLSFCKARKKHQYSKR